ncbi:hypothetical protein [Vibrio sp. LaRot3]|uniref:hypothetical protein n=1 Tax=Vibrio sp. LaRot3 TaxID=2998829 RepID=UPI0022CE2B0D|nr:hypothetical protein [Vibrio sp. LaRot3]MDA0147406.1 hypothetical protein [Vibrio sp. LaRot3]
MKNSLFRLGALALIASSFSAYSAEPILECSNQATEKARALFLDHYQRKDYDAAYYALYLYTDACPNQFGALASEQALWLLSDYALVATKFEKAERCNQASELIQASSNNRTEGLERAFQTNLSLCSVQQLEKQTEQYFSRSSCAHDKSMLTLPVSWQARFAGYQNVECIGPKTLKPNEQLHLLVKNETGGLDKVTIKTDQAIEGEQTRLLFLDEDKPVILANLFNPKGSETLQPADKPIEYLTARNAQPSPQQLAQVKAINKGMSLIIADKGAQASQEYMEKMKSHVASDFTVNSNATWYGKELVTEQSFSSSTSYVVAQYDGQVKVIFSRVSSPEIRQLDLLTGEESLLYTMPADVQVSAVSGSKVYLTYYDDRLDAWEIDLGQDEIKALPTDNPPNKITGYASDFVPSSDGKAYITASDSALKVESNQHDSIIIDDVYNGWVINNLGWGIDNYEFYFDNSSAYACIWRADLLEKRLERIVPIEDAVRPYAFRIGNVPYVLYSRYWEKKLFIASPKPTN